MSCYVINVRYSGNCDSLMLSMLYSPSLIQQCVLETLHPFEFRNTLKVIVRTSPFTSLCYHRIRVQRHDEL